MHILTDLHTHSLASGHAYSTITEMASRAAETGLEALAITDHAPDFPGGPHKFHFHNMRVFPEYLEGVRLFTGIEVDIIDFEGNVDMNNEIMNQLDVVIASFHSPCIKPGTIDEHTQALVNAAKNPNVDILGHPTDSDFPFHVERVVRTAKEHNTLIEINNNSLSPNSFRKNGWDNTLKLLEVCKKTETQVVVGSDAHIASVIGDFSDTYRIMKEAQFPENLILNRSLSTLNGFLS